MPGQDAAKQTPLQSEVADLPALPGLIDLSGAAPADKAHHAPADKGVRPDAATPEMVGKKGDAMDAMTLAKRDGATDGKSLSEAPSASAAEDTRPLPATAQAAGEEMEQVIRALLADFPTDGDALDLAAQVHLHVGRSSEAAECWQKALERNPNDVRAYCGLASIARIRNDPAEQLRLLRKALAADVRSFDAQFDLAKALVDQGQNREAIQLLKAHVQLYPNSPRSYSLLGAAYLQENAFKEAKEAYLTAVKLEPRDDFPYLGLAKACARLGEHEEAKQHQQKFESLRNATRRNVRSHRGRYEDLTAQSDTLSNVCVKAGRIYASRQRNVEAERLWRRAAAISPSHIDSRKALVELYLRGSRKAEAIRVLEQLVSLVPAEANYWLELGRLLVESGRWDHAEKTLKQACERSPKSAAGYAALAEMYLKRDGRSADAVAAARQAAELEATAAHYGLLATACRRHGDTRGALAALEKAIELDPGNLVYREMQQALEKGN